MELLVSSCNVSCCCWQPIERKPRVFAPLVIPKDLQRALPFKDKPKVPKSSKDPVQSNRIAVVREPKERQVGQLKSPLLCCCHLQKCGLLLFKIQILCVGSKKRIPGFYPRDAMCRSGLCNSDVSVRLSVTAGIVSKWKELAS